MARVLVNVPKTAKKGDVIDIKILISHPMESGQRRGDDGRVIPRKIINNFVCMLNGNEVLTLDLFPAIAANPFFAFSAVAEESGTLSMTWVDDDGTVQTQLADITVT
jgi:sulfur-oxidizing protein SoxZ